MSTAPEKYANLEQQVQRIYKKRSQKQVIAKVCGIVGTVAFLLLSCLLSYSAFYYFDGQYPVEEQTLTALTALNDLCKPLMSTLQFGAQPWYIVVPICLATIILVPFILNILTAIVVSVCYKGNAPTAPQDHPIGTLKALIDTAQTTIYSVKSKLDDRRSLISWLYLLSLGALMAYAFIMVNYPLEQLLPVLVGMAFCGLILYWIYRIPLNIFCALSKLLWKYDAKPANALVSQLKSELSAATKAEKEEADRKAKIEAEARRKEGDELYKQATAGEEPDEALIRKAADLGSADACLYYGRQLMGQWSSGLLTRDEKKAYVKRAAKYLEFPAATNKEARFLWLLARAQFESNDKNEWKAMLSEVRSIKASGELREEYEETCDILLKSLVGIIDRTPEAVPRREPKVKRKYCKFNNAGICNRLSTASYIAHCNYMDNPGQCATALMDKGLAFEFEY